MSEANAEVMSVKILPPTPNSPQGKLAEAELIFEANSGSLKGMRLVGFAIWERRGGGQHVTFPARSYSVNGDRRSFVLLRPVEGEHSAQDVFRQRILDAYTRAQAGS